MYGGPVLGWVGRCELLADLIKKREGDLGVWDFGKVYLGFNFGLAWLGLSFVCLSCGDCGELRRGEAAW